MFIALLTTKPSRSGESMRRVIWLSFNGGSIVATDRTPHVRCIDMNRHGHRHMALRRSAVRCGLYGYKHFTPNGVNQILF
jgi:hypothetical protein